MATFKPNHAKVEKENKNSEIVVQSLRYVIPFYYDVEKTEDFDSIDDEIISGNNWKRDRDMTMNEYSQPDTYLFVRSFFLPSDTRSNIGCAYEYIGKDKNPTLQYNRLKQRPITMAINKSGLFLFRSGIGLFWYETMLPKDIRIEELILLQHDFRELAYTRGYSEKTHNKYYLFTVAGKKQDGSSDNIEACLYDNKNEEPFLMREWIGQITGTLPLKPEYFSKRTLTDRMGHACDYPDCALMFNYVVLPEITDRSAQTEIAFFLTNGYDRSFHIPDDFEKEVFSPFKNVQMYTSINGSGYYAVASSDNRYFFERIMPRRINQDYFLIYILALYENFYVLHLSAKISEIMPADHRMYLNDPGELLKKIKKLETEISVFLVKSIHSSVSYISHQNDYFLDLYRRLRIKENIDSLMIGMDSLQSLQETKHQEYLLNVEKEENDERRKTEGSVNIGLGIISFFVLFSAYADIDTTVRILMNIFNWPDSSYNTIYLVCFVITSAVFALALCFVIRAVVKTKQRKNQR